MAEEQDDFETFLNSFPWGMNVKEALTIAFKYSQIDGAHHKTWCIDQMVKALLGDRYNEFVKIVKDGEDGPETYEWNEGIPP